MPKKNTRPAIEIDVHPNLYLIRADGESTEHRMEKIDEVNAVAAQFRAKRRRVVIRVFDYAGKLVVKN